MRRFSQNQPNWTLAAGASPSFARRRARERRERVFPSLDVRRRIRSVRRVRADAAQRRRRANLVSAAANAHRRKGFAAKERRQHQQQHELAPSQATASGGHGLDGMLM